MLRAMIASGFLFFVLAASCAFGWVYMQGNRTLALEKPLTLKLERGSGLKKFATVLHQSLPGTSEKAVYTNLRFFQNFEKFQAGTYRFDRQTTLNEIAETIRAGKVHREILHSFTIPEGFSIPKIAARLSAKGLGTQAEFYRIMRSQAFLRKMGISGAKTLEGFMYPATYSFYEKKTPEQVVKKLVDTFWQNLPDHYASQAKKIGLSLVDAVSIASMIELETSVDSERPMVGEVILSRLRDRQPLGIDAALIYGIKGYDGDIKTVHLRDKTNPYNNRIYAGLPPTPIGSPSKKSLEAVLRPTNTGYYFYVLLDPKTGKHHFSKTLAEHNRYVRRLINRGKAKENNLNY